MSKKDAYVKKAEARIEEESAKLSQARARAKGTAADARLKAEEEIDQLEKHLATAKAKLGELKEAGEDMLEDITEGFEKKWDEVSTGVKKFLSRFS